MSSPYLDLACGEQITRLRPGGAYVLRVPKECDEAQQQAIGRRIDHALRASGLLRGPTPTTVIVLPDSVCILDLTERLREQGAQA